MSRTMAKLLSYCYVRTDRNVSELLWMASNDLKTLLKVPDKWRWRSKWSEVSVSSWSVWQGQELMSCQHVGSLCTLYNGQQYHLTALHQVSSCEQSRSHQNLCVQCLTSVSQLVTRRWKSRGVVYHWGACWLSKVVSGSQGRKDWLGEVVFGPPIVGPCQYC